MDLENQKNAIIKNFEKNFFGKNNSLNQKSDLDTILIFLETKLQSVNLTSENLTKLFLLFLENFEYIISLNKKNLEKNINDNIKIILSNIILSVFLTINQKKNFDDILKKILSSKNFEKIPKDLNTKNLLETNLKEIITVLKIFKNKENSLFEIFFKFFLENIEILKINKNNKKTFALILEILRVLSDKKINLKKLSISEIIFSKLIDSMVYYNEILKIKKKKGNLKILLIIIKIIRNMIFNKAAIKKKNLLKNFYDVFISNLDNEKILIDMLRILNKISEKEKMSIKISGFENLENILMKIFEDWKKNNYILSGNLDFLGNLLTYNKNFSKKIYSSKIMDYLIFLFEKNTDKTNDEKDNYEDMLKSFTSFEFLKKNEQEFIEKLIRIFANIFTCEENSILFLQKNFNNYKKILKTLRYFLNEEQNSNKTLLLSVFGFLTNIFYYENNSLFQNDFELKKLKLDLLTKICYIILNPKNEDILIDGLRVIANLSKSKEVNKHLFKLKYYEGLIILLEHNDYYVVYNSIGCLINLSNSDFFYNDDKIFEKCLEGLAKTQIFNFDILFIACQLVSNILNFEKNNENVFISRIGVKICEDFLRKGTKIVEIGENDGKDTDFMIKGKKIEQILASSKAMVETLKNESNLLNY